jgi:hypothetical protein
MEDLKPELKPKEHLAQFSHSSFTGTVLIGVKINGTKLMLKSSLLLPLMGSVEISFMEMGIQSNKTKGT